MITFNVELEKFKLSQLILHKKWLNQIAQSEGFKVIELNYIFMSDHALHEINVNYLNHDTLTDIITFDNSDTNTHNFIEGDIFISVERVKENAKMLKTGFESELHRVMAHGLLHLCGYKDKSKAEAETMRKKEEEALEMYFRLFG